VFRRGIPITKRRRFNELSNADAVWFLPIQRGVGQKLRNIPEKDRMTMLFSSEAGQTRVSSRYECGTNKLTVYAQIFALSTKATPEQIGRIGTVTISVGAFFGRTCEVHVSPSQVSLLDSGECSWNAVIRD
jgi:cleavage and polyadenylation specificity factor subunit 1